MSVEKTEKNEEKVPEFLKFEASEGGTLGSPAAELAEIGARYLENSSEDKGRVASTTAKTVARSLHYLSDFQRRRINPEREVAVETLNRIAEGINNWSERTGHGLEMEPDGPESFEIYLRASDSLVGEVGWDRQKGVIKGEIDLMSLYTDTDEYQELRREIDSAMDYWGPGGRTWESNPHQNNLKKMGEI